MRKRAKRGRPPKEYDRIQVCINPTLKEILTDNAKNAGYSRSEYIQELLIEVLKIDVDLLKNNVNAEV